MFCLGLVTPLFADGTNVLTDEKSRASYAYGMLNGKQWKSQDVGFDVDLYVQGLKDGLAGGNTLITEAEAKDAMATFQKEFRAKMMAKAKATAETNKAIGEAFLATNKLVAGVQVLKVALPNGQTNELQYLVITNGSGPTPKANEQVSVNYRGTLLDGTEFDSSYKRGKPTTFPVERVIKGWSEALKIMPVGSKWKLFIPGELAYGDRGQQNIPPNSLLVFEVELLGVEAAPAPTPSRPATTTAPLTSDIIKVPSAEELKKGAKIETIKAEDVQKAQEQQQQK